MGEYAWNNTLKSGINRVTSNTQSQEKADLDEIAEKKRNGADRQDIMDSIDNATDKYKQV